MFSKSNDVNYIESIDDIELTPLMMQEISVKMSFWEHIVRIFLFLTKSSKLKLFYFKCSLKHLEQEFSELHPDWYHSSTKELQPEFAHILFKLAKGMFILGPILKATIINSEFNKIQIQKNPLPVEMIFHTLYTKELLQAYPFTFQNLCKNQDSDLGVPFQNKEQKLVENYLEQISIEEIDQINHLYSRFIYFSRLLNVPLLDFSKRFNHAVNFTSLSVNDEQWKPVTISALTHYLNLLYKAVNNVDLIRSDFDTMRLLNLLYQECYPQASIISEDILRKAWNNVLNVITLFQTKDALLKLLRISSQNVFLSVPKDRSEYVLFPFFTTALNERMKGMSIVFLRDMTVYKIDSIMQKIFPNINMKTLGIGFYSMDNREKFVRLGIHGFRYIEKIVLIEYFIQQFARGVLKPIASFVLFNAKFVHSKDHDLIEIAYKKLSKFHEQFDIFINEVNHDAPIGNKISAIIQQTDDKPIANSNERLKIFVSSIDSQAQTIVKDFSTIIAQISYLISKIVNSLSKNSTDFIENIQVLKAFLDDDLIAVLNHSLEFCDDYAELESLTSQFEQYNSEFTNK
ncbi:MAG: hypothetical protein ACRCTQ_02070 [Brevinemataceae bacterium]